MKVDKLVSPKGYAQFPALKTPDTKFNTNGGDYRVTMRFPKDDPRLAKMLSAIGTVLDDFYENDEKVKKALSAGKKLVKGDYFEEWKDEEGNEWVDVKFKQKAKITKKDGSTIDIHIPIFDSKGKPIDVDVGRDSVLKVCFVPVGYYTPSTKIVGVTLRLTAVQVIELKTGGSGSAESYGFEEEEGYVSEDDDPPFESADSAGDLEEDHPDF